MRLSAGIFTFNPIRQARLDWLQRVILELENGDCKPVAILQGDDDTGMYLGSRLGVTNVIEDDSNTSIWYGQSRLVEFMRQDSPEWIYLSADDVILRPGWRPLLDRYCAALPDDVVLTSLQMEPEFPWSKTAGRVEYGGVEGLQRESVPGDSWLFRTKDWTTICLGGSHLPELEPGPDLHVCTELVKQGYRLVQLDLADHVGALFSTWGNRAHLVDARPLDREKWGLRGNIQ